MDLTVVIPARNEAGTIETQLNALRRQDWDGDWEIVVVDNGSTDGTGDVVADVASRDPRVRLLSYTGTPGICPARNAGIRAAESDFIAVCDADDMVAPGWMAAMADGLRGHALVTGPLELELLNPSWLAASRGRAGAIGVPTFHGIFPYVRGGNFGIHRALFDAVGGFDQSLIGAEDLEFGMRVWEAGVEVGYAEQAVLHCRYRHRPLELYRQGFTYAINRPEISRRLRELGESTPPRLAGWRSWGALVLGLRRIASPEGRALVCWGAGNRLGHLIGSVRARTILL